MNLCMLRSSKFWHNVVQTTIATYRLKYFTINLRKHHLFLHGISSQIYKYKTAPRAFSLEIKHFSIISLTKKKQKNNANAIALSYTFNNNLHVLWCTLFFFFSPVFHCNNLCHLLFEHTFVVPNNPNDNEFNVWNVPNHLLPNYYDVNMENNATGRKKFGIKLSAKIMQMTMTVK